MDKDDVTAAILYPNYSRALIGYWQTHSKYSNTNTFLQRGQDFGRFEYPITV
jgi:hypothetical protein